jgi:zeta-carotene desaturase
LDRLLSNSGLSSELLLKTQSGELCNLDRFQASPIIAIQLWFDRVIMDEEFSALIDTRVQWVFNKTKLFRAISTKGARLSDGQGYASGAEPLRHGVIEQCLSLVISGAQEFVEMSKEDLLKIAMEDLRRVLSKAKNANIVHSIVIKEKRATFSPVPGLEAIRPFPETSFSNLFLAGDWTATGYPATIESAVMSGQKAAEEIIRFLQTR